MSNDRSIQKELELHKLATIRAMETGQEELTRRRLDLYIHLAEAFLDELTKRGIKYDRKQASEVSSLDWPLLSEITQHVYDLIVAAVNTNNSRIISIAAYTPIKFLKLSLTKGDFLFFSKILPVYPAILWKSYRLTSEDVKAQTAELSWRYLKEFADLILASSSHNLSQDKALVFINDILWKFNDLLKITIDYADEATFREIVYHMNKLFDRVHYEKGTSWQLEEVSLQIQKQKQVILFGLGSWLVRTIINKPEIPRIPGIRRERAKQISPDQISSFFQPILGSFPNIKNLSEIYFDALENDHDSTWDGWIIEGLPEGEVHTIDFRRYLTYFYCIQGIRLTPPAGQKWVDLPMSQRQLEYQIKDIGEICKSISTNVTQWDKILNPNQISNWQGFVDINETAVSIYRRSREDEIIASSISKKRITAYQEEVLKAWSSSGWMDYLFRKYGRIEKAVAGDNSTYFAIYELRPKESFLEITDTSWVGFGSSDGRVLGRDLSRNILDFLLNSIQSTEVSHSLQELTEIIIKYLSESRNTENYPQAIIIMGNYTVESSLLSSGHLIPSWSVQTLKLNVDNYIGTLNDIPVFLETDPSLSAVLLVNFNRLGIYKIYSPPTDNYDDVKIIINELNENEIENQATKELEELSKKRESKSKEEIIRKLKQNVKVFVGYKYELIIQNIDGITRVDYQK